MAISRRPLDVDNYSALDGGTGLAIPGYYRRTNLNDIINNFIVAYIGDGKVLTEVPRYEVALDTKIIKLPKRLPTRLTLIIMGGMIPLILDIMGLDTV